MVVVCGERQVGLDLFLLFPSTPLSVCPGPHTHFLRTEMAVELKASVCVRDEGEGLKKLLGFAFPLSSIASAFMQKPAWKFPTVFSYLQWFEMFK